MDPKKRLVLDSARELVRSVEAGVLSTLSVDVAGYPFGSVTPYAAMHDGTMVIQLSSIAQHTKNIAADHRVCLTIIQDGGTRPNPQAAGRVSIIGDASLTSGDDAKAAADRYFTFFPSAREYENTHDFSFYAISPVRIRFIAGFGGIHWIERDDWTRDEREWQMGESAIVGHMNADHADSLRAMCTRFCDDDSSGAEMLTVDADGFHIRTERAIHYLRFEKHCVTSNDVRAEMVRLARSSALGPA